MKMLIAVLLLLTTVACAPQPSTTSQPPAAVVAPSDACSKPADKHLLIMGDSISMGYTPYVQQDLCSLYTVKHIGYPEGVNPGMIQNAQGTVFTLANMDRWIAQAGPLDVIIWNNGLWDSYSPSYDASDATDLPTYQANLIAIATRLKATGARVLFFTTTDIPADGQDPATGQAFVLGRDLDNNIVANSVLPALGVEVYDLNAMARSNPKLHLSNDPIHFDAQGYSLFGEFISDMVKANYQYSN